MLLLPAIRRQRALRVAAASTVVVALGGLGLQSLTAAPPPDPLGEKTGGDTTVFATGRNAFSFP
ncbi:MAG: thiol oxidoreductase, partial [Acidovorax sp.]|nr:thiol oxidoreductase [Acidovorax sp.]